MKKRRGSIWPKHGDEKHSTSTTCWVRRLLTVLLCAVLLGAAGGDQDRIYFRTDETWSITRSYAVRPRLSGRDWASLQGLRVLFLGDSQFCGYAEEEHDDLWTTRLETEFGLRVKNCSATGSTITDGLFDGYVFQGRADPICIREIPNGAYDVIFVCGAYNDWLLNEPLGTVDSRDTCTFSGALNHLFDRLEQLQPDAKLAYMTCFASNGKRNATALTTTDYCRAAIDVCGHRSIPCLMACDPSISGIYAADPIFRECFFLTKSDSWHLNRAGHSLFLPVAGDFLLDLLADKTGDR